MQNLPVGTVTLLFTDIAGSTHLLTHLGDHYGQVLSECRQILRTAFEEWNGNVVDTQGDAFFAVFARATDAIQAGVSAQRALASHAFPHGAAVQVRMGLHTGEPQRTAEGYVGLDVHRAARIMSAAHGGQVLLSQTTRYLVEHHLPEGVSLRDLGAHRLKDFQDPNQLFQLVIAGLPADFPPLKTLASSTNHLPVQPTPFIGREREVAAVGQQLLDGQVRLMTLTGPGGVGKTRLALQVAAELAKHFPDGAWFVSLAPISDTDLVIPAIIQTLGLREVRDQSPLDHLKSSLREKQMLLLLDNFEQVVSAGIHVADLLSVCSRLKVLVTSREGLHVRAEREFPVPALSLPDAKQLPDPAALSQYEAVGLFIERAQAVQPEFQVTNANTPAVAEICTRLDGLPLAIELAAARIKLFPPQALLARLEQRLPFLTRSARDVPTRQQTLRQTIQWSYDLLTTQEQRLFRRLSVFVGGCTMQAIEAVSAAFEDDAALTLDVVASLVDKNLLQQTAQEGEELRLMMLETIREYGLECLQSLGERETARQAHAAYYHVLAQEAVQGLKGYLVRANPAWLERLEREQNNLRAAIEWSLEPAQAGSRLEMAFSVALALTKFCMVRGFYSEGQAILEQLLAHDEGAVPVVRAKTLLDVADFAEAQGDPDRAEVLYQESLALYRQLGDKRGIAYSLRGLGWVAQTKGHNSTTARSLMEECLAIFREVGDQEDIAWSLATVADLVCLQGAYSSGLALFEECLALYRELGHTRGIASCLRQSAAWLFLGARGDQAAVRARLDESLTLYREVGDKLGEALYDWIAGWVVLREGDADTAHTLMKQSLALCRELGDRWHMVLPLELLGRIEALQGDFAAARLFHEEGLAKARTLDDYWLCAFCLEGLASVVAAQGAPAWAARLWGAAESLRERCGIPLTPVEQAVYTPAVAAVRMHLGEQGFHAAWTQGRGMTAEQALAAQEGSTLTPVSTPAGSSPTPPATLLPASPDDLTPREVEVLRLLAQGWTDAHIAEQLVISPRTVNNHLTSIYRKIQVSSRAAATRYALEHHLV